MTEPSESSTVEAAAPRSFARPVLRLGLRWAMLVAMVPMLLLPFAGLLFLADMANLTREERESQLASAARGYAGALHERDDLFGRQPRAPWPGGAKAMPVTELSAVQVDGIADEWRAVSTTPVRSTAVATAPQDTLQVRMAVARVARQRGRLYLWVEVTDERYLEPVPSLVTGVEIEAAFQAASRQTAAGRAVGVGTDPGPRPSDQRDGDLLLIEAGETHDRLRALDVSVTQSASGWRAELAIAPTTRYLRVRIRDIDYQATRALEATADSGLLALGNLADGSDAAAALDKDSRGAVLANLLRGFARAGGRITVVDAQGESLGSLGEPESAPAPVGGGIGRMLVSWAVSLGVWNSGLAPRPDPLAQAQRGFAATRSQRLTSNNGGHFWLTTSAQPIWLQDRVAGALVLEQADSSDLARAQSAFEWLAMFTAIAIIATILTLLGFATLVVMRIRSLKRAAEQAIDARGRVVGVMPTFRIRDEVASLSDGYARVLGRLREHQQYLANLRARLVHELRTPIMVVRSSLDNLGDVAADDPNRDAYVQRALGGTLRLERIVASMSEAANLESMLGDNPLEEIDLVALLQDLVSAYGQAYGARDSQKANGVGFAFESGLARATCAVVPDAIAQAVDKLAANARDYAQPGSVIKLQLAVGQTSLGRPAYRIVMRNQGPALPELMTDSLFDSMVSIRNDAAPGESHLGLGLYLVRLIAEFHGGEPFARNEPGGVAVGFMVAQSQ